MLSEFDNFVRKNKLFSKKDKLLLAISGGIDSICLFHILLANGYKFSLAHCNFHLRGKESDSDEAFLRKLASKHQIQIYVQDFDTKNESLKIGKGTQETARLLRYQWFQTLLKKEKFKKILTAHHLSDNTETMLINLMRSTGISGLHGIPITSNTVVRPLMFTDRTSIERYIAKKRLSFRKDASNESDDYLRNRIRHHVIPELMALDKHTDQLFLATAMRIKEFEQMNSDLMQVIWKSEIEIKDEVIFIKDSIFNYSSRPEVLLYYLLKEYGFKRSATAAFGNPRDIQTGKKIVSGEWTLCRERKGFSLFKSHISETKSLIIPAGKKKTKNTSFSVLISNVNTIDIDYNTSDTIYFDNTKCIFPLELRFWKQSDKMQPLGMKGSKKISDILTDKKLAHSKRKTQMVLVNGNGEIIALFPSVCSELYRIMPNSKSALAVRAKIL